MDISQVISESFIGNYLDFSMNPLNKNSTSNLHNTQSDVNYLNMIGKMRSDMDTLLMNLAKIKNEVDNVTKNRFCFNQNPDENPCNTFSPKSLDLFPTFPLNTIPEYPDFENVEDDSSANLSFENNILRIEPNFESATLEDSPKKSPNTFPEPNGTVRISDLTAALSGWHKVLLLNLHPRVTYLEVVALLNTSGLNDIEDLVLTNCDDTSTAVVTFSEEDLKMKALSLSTKLTHRGRQIKICKYTDDKKWLEQQSKTKRKDEQNNSESNKKIKL